MSDETLRRVRGICLALPEAFEQEAWGHPTFRVKDKLFAMFHDDHHGDGRVALWLNAPLGVQEHLVVLDPERFFVPPYVGPRGWIGVRLDRVEDAEVEDHVVQSYCMVAPKRLIARLDE